jgi:smad nuclear-interacting protein 1
MSPSENTDNRRHRHRNRSSDRSRDRKWRDRSRSRSPRSRQLGRPRYQAGSAPFDKRVSPQSRSRSRSPIRKRGPLLDQVTAFRASESNALQTIEPSQEKQKPNFSNTGLLAREANRLEGTNISLKYHEPPEARKPPPSLPWVCVIFKNDEHIQTLPLSSKSCWLVGREPKIADILAEHPSVSGQHAAIQFRYTEKKTKPKHGDDELMDINGPAKKKGKVRPYLIDLESANGTVLDGERIESGRYHELRHADVVKFGLSEREYTFLLPPQEAAV